MPDETLSENGAPPTVRALGQAQIRTEPDEAFVWITLSALEPTPGAALGDVARRTDALVRVLDELGIAREDRSTAGVRVNEETHYERGGRKSLGHTAESSISVRLTNTKLIGQLILRATGELDARVDGPEWRVSHDNPAWLEAATLAAASARAKAEAYAKGVGAQLDELISLSEPDHQHVRRSGIMPARRAAAVAASGGPDMPIEAGEHDVTATVQATFTLRPSQARPR